MKELFPQSPEKSSNIKFRSPVLRLKQKLCFHYHTNPCLKQANLQRRLHPILYSAKKTIADLILHTDLLNQFFCGRKVNFSSVLRPKTLSVIHSRINFHYIFFKYSHCSLQMHLTLGIYVPVPLNRLHFYLLSILSSKVCF